jgi:hypothetical protein
MCEGIIQMDTMASPQQPAVENVYAKSTTKANRHVLFEATVYAEQTELKSATGRIHRSPWNPTTKEYDPRLDFVQWKAETNLGAGVSKMTLDDWTLAWQMSPGEICEVSCCHLQEQGETNCV